MNFPLGRPYSLVARGEAGVSCDQYGVALGELDLVRASRVGGVRSCVVRPRAEVREILRAVFGAQPDEVVSRLHRGLQRVAAWIEAADVGQAGIETVMLGLPNLTPGEMAKLATISKFEKASEAPWESEPRVPAGRSDGGQWTTGGGSGASANANRDSAKPAAFKPVGDKGIAIGLRFTLPLNDGVYRPGAEAAALTHTGGVEEEQRFGSNGPPDDFTNLAEVFPALRDTPALAIPLSPIDSFLGVSSSANAANLDAVSLQYRSLIKQIKDVDPGFTDDELLPPGGLAGMSWQGRANLLDGLRMQRAAILYRVRGDVGPLQVETLKMLQTSVDQAYAAAVKLYAAGRLQARLSREEAIGNFVDTTVRFDLRQEYNEYGIRYGAGSDITINNSDYIESDSTYTVPDARVRNVSFDWSLTAKNLSSRQVRGFFNASSRPVAVIIIRPSQLGRNSTYLIPRPGSIQR